MLVSCCVKQGGFLLSRKVLKIVCLVSDTVCSGKCALNTWVTSVSVLPGLYQVMQLIQYVRPVHCFIDSSVKSVCTNHGHSIRTWSNRQESLKDHLQHIYQLHHNVAATGAAATSGVFPPNNGSIWRGRWMVVLTGSFKVMFFSFLW